MKRVIAFTAVALFAACSGTSSSGSGDFASADGGNCGVSEASATGDSAAIEAGAIDSSADAGANAGGVGTDGAAATDAGAPTVKALPGLVLWLDDTVGMIPDTTTGKGAILKWLDQSGNGNDAVAVKNTVYPTIHSAAINGLDAVSCAGNLSRLEIADSPTLQWGKGDFAIAMVVSQPTQNKGITLYQKYNNTPGILFTEDDTQVFKLLTGPVMVAAEHATTPFQIVVVRGQALELRAGSNVSFGGTNADDVSALGENVQVCTAGPSGQQYDLAELVAVKGTLSDPDLANLTAYFKSKFKL